MTSSLIRCYFIRSLLLLVVLTSQTDAAIVSGFLFDTNGNPVNNSDLDYIDAATGQKLVYSNYDDNTNIFGAYQSPILLPGVYHIVYDSPDSTHLMGTQVFNIDLTSYGLTQNIVLDTVFLESGVVISGRVTDDVGAPLGYVNLNVDSISGGRVFTSNDKTDSLNGAYWIVVPPDTYRIRYKPPPGTNWRGIQLDSVTISGDTIINLSLASGIILNGTVTDIQGQGLYDIDVDLRVSSTGEKVYLPNNSTDSSGFYNVAVPAGMFTLRFTPPLGSNLVGEKVDSFTITFDRTWDQVLQRGVIFTAAVYDSIGNPVPGADLDFKLESNGNKVFTPNDKTNDSGIAIVSVLPDIYTIQITPPLGTSFDQLIVPGVSVLSDMSMDFLLPEAPRVNFSGRVTDLTTNGLPDIKIDLRNTITGEKAYIANNMTDSTGAFNLAVPIGTYDLLFSPPKGSRYVGKRIENVTFALDTIWGTVVLESGLMVTAYVLDDLDIPVPSVDFDFISESTGIELLTPYDNTDTLGISQVSIPSDMYTINLNPPLGSTLLSLSVKGVNIQNDTSITFKLSKTTGSQPPTGFSLQQNYPNPFNNQTIIPFDILTNSEVSVNIYNILGQHVKTLEDRFFPAGSYQLRWDGTNQNSKSVASGLYFYQLKTTDGTETRQMVLIR